MKKISVIILLLSYSMLTKAQITKEDITVTFFKQFEKDPLTAYMNVFSNNKWMADKKSTLETTRIQLKDLLDQLGQYHGYELITEKKAGDSYILKSFLAKYDRQPVRFIFILYKPNQDWQIQNLSYDVDVDTELKEAAKVDRLKDNW
jgi:hypothetical protein